MWGEAPIRLQVIPVQAKKKHSLSRECFFSLKHSDVVHDVPHLTAGELVTERRHQVFTNDDVVVEEPVGVTALVAILGSVAEVRNDVRTAPFGSHSAFTLTGGAVTLSAVESVKLGTTLLGLFVESYGILGIPNFAGNAALIEKNLRLVLVQVTSHFA